MTYLVDTSVIIDVLNGKQGRDALLRSLVQAGNLLACCPINVIEVYAGMRPHQRAQTDELLSSLECYEITWEVATTAGLLKRDWARRGITLSLPDVTVAAVALVNNLELMTDNSRHYPMPELKLYRFPYVN